MQDTDYLDTRHIKLYKTPKDWSFGFEANVHEAPREPFDSIVTLIFVFVLYFGPYTLELSA